MFSSMDLYIFVNKYAIVYWVDFSLNPYIEELLQNKISPFEPVIFEISFFKQTNSSALYYLNKFFPYTNTSKIHLQNLQDWPQWLKISVVEYIDQCLIFFFWHIVTCFEYHSENTPKYCFKDAFHVRSMKVRKINGNCRGYLPSMWFMIINCLEILKIFNTHSYVDSNLRIRRIGSKVKTKR